MTMVKAKVCGVLTMPVIVLNVCVCYLIWFSKLSFEVGTIIPFLK